MAVSSPIGMPVSRVEGKGKVTGQAKYTADFAVPAMLWGALLRSTVPHARIARIDTSKARALTGVHAVLTGRDIGEVRFGRAVADIAVLAHDLVRYVGEPVAAVAADGRDVAFEALALIEVEYEELPAVMDPSEALKPDAPVLHPNSRAYRWGGERRGGGDEEQSHAHRADHPNIVSYEVESKGDVEEGFRRADLVVEHSYRTGIQHQGYMEPHTCVVSAEPDGKVRIWAANKSPFVIRNLLALDLGVGEKDIVVEPTWVGGDYGGKGSPLPIPMAYYLSRSAGRPVKLVMDGPQEYVASNPRHLTSMTIRTGLKRDGSIVARDFRMTCDSGAYAGYKPIPGPVLVGSHHALGVYKTPHARFECSIVYTNHVPAGHMRSPGSFQSSFACEVDVDRLAEAVGMDPIEFRLKNGVADGDLGPLGEPWSSVHLKECLETVRDRSGWGQPKPANVGRGVAVAQATTGGGGSTSQIEVYPDGTVGLMTSVSEQGSGMLTVLAQVVAHEFQVPMESVKVTVLSTEAELWDRGSSAVSVTHVAGQATIKAVGQAREKLNAVACEFLGCQPHEVQFAGGLFRDPDGAAAPMSLAEVAAQACEGGQPVTGYCRYDAWQRDYATAFIAQVAEVEVDRRTGKVTVRRIVSATEAGVVLNPTGASGQVEGATIIGLGGAMMEELRLVDGRVQSPGLREYKLPTSGDLPIMDNVLIESGGGGPGPYGAKTVADLALIVAPAAIANAVYDAAGVRIEELPITAEKVYRALATQRSGR